jgi:hypothetical protein
VCITSSFRGIVLNIFPLNNISDCMAEFDLAKKYSEANKKKLIVNLERIAKP